MFADINFPLMNIVSYYLIVKNRVPSCLVRQLNQATWNPIICCHATVKPEPCCRIAVSIVAPCEREASKSQVQKATVINSSLETLHLVFTLISTTTLLGNSYNLIEIPKATLWKRVLAIEGTEKIPRLLSKVGFGGTIKACQPPW